MVRCQARTGPRAGKKVWLLMHAPPGADEDTTAPASNDNGQISAATMMWVDANQDAVYGHH